MACRSALRATSARARTRQSPPARRRPPRHWLLLPSVRPPSRPPPAVSPAPSSFAPCHRGAGAGEGAAASPSAETPVLCPKGTEPPPWAGPGRRPRALTSLRLCSTRMRLRHPTPRHQTLGPAPACGVSTQPRPGRSPPPRGRGRGVTEPRPRRVCVAPGWCGPWGDLDRARPVCAGPGKGSARDRQRPLRGAVGRPQGALSGKERDLGRPCALEAPRAVGGGVGSRSSPRALGGRGAVVDARGSQVGSVGRQGLQPVYRAISPSASGHRL